MALTQYQRGRAFEYRIIKDLQKRGFWCMRAAQSKGIVDVLGLSRGQILLVQAKISGALGPAERKELVELATEVGGMPVLAERSDGRTLSYWLVYLDTRREPAPIPGYVDVPRAASAKVDAQVVLDQPTQ